MYLAALTLLKWAKFGTVAEYLLFWGQLRLKTEQLHRSIQKQYQHANTNKNKRETPQHTLLTALYPDHANIRESQSATNSWWTRERMLQFQVITSCSSRLLIHLQRTIHIDTMLLAAAASIVIAVTVTITLLKVGHMPKLGICRDGQYECDRGISYI